MMGIFIALKEVIIKPTLKVIGSDNFPIKI